MTNCPQCGAVDQNGKFCVQCGAALPVPAPYGAPTAPTVPTVSEPAVSDTVLRRGQAWPVADSPQFGAVGGMPPPPTPPYAPQPVPQRSGRVSAWWVVAAAAVVVVAISVTAVVLLNRGGEGGSGGIAATATALPPASPTPSGGPVTTGSTEAQRTADAASGSATAATVSGATVSAAPGPGSVASVQGTTAPAPAPVPTVASGLAATQQAAIPCGNAYIVQVASELDQAVFAARVSAVQSANQLPPGSKWTQTSDSCAIFTSQVNALVLYSGPYASPYDACPARLASPPDAFIKGTTPDTSNTYISCLCPAEASSLPLIRTVGEQGVWIGELQRVLGSRLEYNVGSINADPSVGDPGRWGTYTADTAAAVGRFQASVGLPVTSQVDAATWAALRGQSC